MATSTGFTPTPSRTRVEKGVTEVWGSLAVAAGDYAAGGLAISFSALEAVKTRSVPLWVKVEGKSGFVYSYSEGTGPNDGKIMIFTNTAGGVNAALGEHTVAALVAGVTGDTLRFYAAFKFND